MTTVRKPTSGKWNTQIRCKGHPTISKSFIAQKDAYIWIRNIKSAMDKGIFINRSSAKNTTFAEALIRYRNEVTPSKKGMSTRNSQARTCSHLTFVYHCKEEWSTPIDNPLSNIEGALDFV